MYLYGQRSPANLGSYLRGGRGLGRLGYRPNQAVQRAVYRRKQPVLSGLRGYRGMGQDITDLYDTTPAVIPTTLFPMAPDTIDTSSAYGISTTLSPLATAPSGGSVTYAPLTASDIAQQNAYTALMNSATPITNVSDYVSPQAAIAAGAPPATVNAVWATSQGVNSFSSPSAATAALTASMGAANAAATVAKLWTGGGQKPPSAVSSSLLTGSIGGIPTTALLAIGGLALVFGLMSGGKR
jgi:uncharacterized iron-regulated membrane protein